MRKYHKLNIINVNSRALIETFNIIVIELITSCILFLGILKVSVKGQTHMDGEGAAHVLETCPRVKKFHYYNL